MIVSKGNKENNRRLIIGGHNIGTRRYPYFASIEKNNGIIVNGVLIAPDIILSAGHIALNHMDNLTLKVGPYAVHNTNETFVEEIKVERWVVPSTWAEPHPGFFTEDYLILKLAGRSAHRPIQLNRQPEIPRPEKDVVTMIGLGWTNASFSSPANIVQEVVLETVSNLACNAAHDPLRGLTYSGKIDLTMLCTISPPNTTRDGCALDSGAPVIIAGQGPEADILVALGSTGIGCADHVFPAIQARVSSGLHWIEQQVCALSSHPPPDFSCSGYATDMNQSLSTIATSMVPIYDIIHHSRVDVSVSYSLKLSLFVPVATVCLVLVLSVRKIMLAKGNRGDGGTETARLCPNGALAGYNATDHFE